MGKKMIAKGEKKYLSLSFYSRENPVIARQYYPARAKPGFFNTDTQIISRFEGIRSRLFYANIYVASINN